MRVRALVGTLAGLVLVTAGCGGGGGSDGATLRVSGSTTVNPVAADAAEVLRKDGLRITVDASGGSAGGIAQLGAGQVEIAMSSKPLADSDRQMFPSVDFVATEIGQDAVGIVVRREVYDGGGKEPDERSGQALFEGKVRNWSGAGRARPAGVRLRQGAGAGHPRGHRQVPVRRWQGTAAARVRRLRNSRRQRGGADQAGVDPGFGRPAVVLVRRRIPQPGGGRPRRHRALAGERAGVAYPISRPLYLVTNGRPAGAARTFVDYVRSEPGQDLVNKHGYLNLADLGLS